MGENGKPKRKVNPLFALGADAEGKKVAPGSGVPSPGKGDGGSGVVSPQVDASESGSGRKGPGVGSSTGAGSDVKPAAAEDFGRRRVNPMFSLDPNAGAKSSPASPFPGLPAKREAGAADSGSGSTGRVVRPLPSIHLEKPPARAGSAGVKKRRYFAEEKPDSIVDAGDWDDESGEPEFGLGAEGGSDVKPQYEKALSLTKRDHVFLRFLARYRYANADQLARLTDSQPKRINIRLNQLAKRGFVRKDTITRGYHVWVATAAGNQVAGIEMPPIRKGSLSYVTLAHTLGLVNLGIEFERENGGKDLLGERKGDDSGEFPKRRWDSGEWGVGDLVVGEHVVTERLIRQGQKSWRGHDTLEMRELVKRAALAGEANGAGAEMEEGQEAMFVVYGEAGYEHVPDMVVVRPRGADGKPEHIAIELELSAKEPREWRKVLRAYRDHGHMYSQVYYFTHKPSINRGLMRVAEAEAGLKDKLRVRKYIPMNDRVPFWG